MINPVVHSISLDIYKIGPQKVLSMVRGDTKRAIVIHLTENERPYSINEECTAYFTAKKPDGNFIYNECEVDFKSNTITYNVTEQTTAVNGKVDCQLRLIDANGGIVSTPSFSFVVADLLYNEEPIVESSSEFNAITAYIASLKQMVANGEFNGKDGGDGADGKSIYIKGSVGYFEELESKIETAIAGEGYLADDDHLYVFDGTLFVDVGLVRGPRGFSGVYVGSGDMPEGYNVQIDPDGAVFELDNKLDRTSPNPISNKAVADALAGKSDANHMHMAEELGYYGDDDFCGNAQTVHDALKNLDRNAASFNTHSHSAADIPTLQEGGNVEDSLALLWGTKLDEGDLSAENITFRYSTDQNIRTVADALTLLLNKSGI